MPFLQRIKQQKLLSVCLLLLTLVLGIVIGTIINTGVKAERQNLAVAPDATPLIVPQAVPISNEFAKLAKRLEHSVVYIESDYLPKSGKLKKQKDSDDVDKDDEEQNPHGQDPSDLFKRFFGKSEPRSFRTEGSGTGFIVDKSGYILTNQHVIDKADRIKVKLNGENAEYKARVIGYDNETDVAVLKIDAKRALEPVTVGNSDSVEVGDWAIAIGSPFGLQATVTAGIVSATSRDLPGTQQFQHFLQTDAAINPGNSGGPLLNIRGEVIGMNTMIATRSGSYEGIGFALPSNMAVRVYNDIIRQGHVVRGSIGIKWSREGSQEETLQAFGLDHGVLVEIVAPGGPAARAGLKADDIILAMNDRPVKDGEELVDKVADLPIGSRALFTVDRNGKRLDFKVDVEERAVVWKDSPQFAENREELNQPVSKETPHQGKFGITIVRLTDKERQDLGIEDNTGVKVVSVDPGSFAEDIALQENDAIISVNRHPISSPGDLMKLQSSLKPGQAVALHIVRSGTLSGRRIPPTRIYVSGRLPEE
ncbi:MAG: Do family serine endopeptidase [Acidobacteriaceae bacterium]|nr:Do family serine endopeptidase [Acidobacteriaceae bacterium]MBV9781125.1 Do family serine endopeptidase [Acidobacteriaceae bacterium]